MHNTRNKGSAFNFVNRFVRAVIKRNGAITNDLPLLVCLKKELAYLKLNGRLSTDKRLNINKETYK